MRAPLVVRIVVLLISVASAPFCAAGDDNPWLIAPPLVKELSAEDQAARDEVVKIIAERRAKISLTGWNLEVPMRASGVPTKYDLVLHRGSGCFMNSDARLEIQVRDGTATWELCDASGIYRLQRPAKDVDRLVRQLAYAFHAVERTKKERLGSISYFSAGPPPHYIELVSRDKRSPLHLQPRYLHAEHDTRGEPMDRIRTHAFADLVSHVFPIAERDCKPIPEAEESREVVARLQGIPVLQEFLDRAARDAGDAPQPTPEDLIRALRADMEPKTADGKPITQGRRDQLWHEREVYADLAVHRGLPKALPELKRLVMFDQYRQLQIATSADPKRLIQEAIAEHEKDEQLATWAQRFAADVKHPERLQWLIDVMPRLEDDAPNEHRADSICFDLARKELHKEQLAQLAKQFSATKNLKSKIGLANVLLTKTHEAKYFTYLNELVRKLPPDQNENSPSPRLAAAHHALKFAIATGKQRAEARALLKKLLTESRSQDKPDSFEMRELVEFLGDLGMPEDTPYLAGLAQTGSPYMMSSATKALAKIDAKRALEILHMRIERWNKQPADKLAYSHEIYSNFELFIFERDAAAVPLLKKAWERFNAKVAAKPTKPVKPKKVDPDVVYWEVDEEEDEPDRISGISEGYNPQHVIAFLEAKNGPARAEAAIAHFGDRAHYEDRSRMERLVKQLVSEGADPKRCEVLLHVPDESRRR